MDPCSTLLFKVNFVFPFYRLVTVDIFSCTSLWELSMYLLKSSICIKGCDFIFRYCSFCVLVNLGLSVCGELGSDDAIFPCYLLVMYLHLLFTIWFPLVLTGIAVSDCG